MAVEILKARCRHSSPSCRKKLTVESSQPIRPIMRTPLKHQQGRVLISHGNEISCHSKNLFGVFAGDRKCCWSGHNDGSQTSRVLLQYPLDVEGSLEPPPTLTSILLLPFWRGLLLISWSSPSRISSLTSIVQVEILQCNRPIDLEYGQSPVLKLEALLGI